MPKIPARTVLLKWNLRWPVRNASDPPGH
jgi:hypothetical protein